MNIGITVYPTYGGSGIVGSELGQALAERGHNVHFISSVLPTRVTELGPRISFHEVEMMSYPLFEHQPYDLALATKMATVARSEKLDLLHVHYAIPHSISAILARESIKQKRYVPVITTLHGTDITLVGADRSYLPITRYGLQQSDGVTAVSKFLETGDDRDVRFRRDRSNTKFHLPESLHKDGRFRAAQTTGAERRKTARSRIEFPARKTRRRLC